MSEENIMVEHGRDPLPLPGGKKGGRGQSKSRDAFAFLDGRACILEEPIGDVKDRLGIVEQNLQTFGGSCVRGARLASRRQGKIRIRKIAIAGGVIVTRSPKVDTPKLKEFGGKQDEKELDNFIWHMERYFEGASITNKMTKVRTAILYLAYTTTLWWRRKHNDGSGSTSDTRTKTSHCVSQVKKLKVSVLVRFQKKPSLFLNWASRIEKFVQQCINSVECLTIRDN
ncbi:hypothetical protein RJ639_015330 [Escallonia herrerae]|uniref:Uncharacterized protein n=1 Tax=Escallonia herrerae TaxID=1293975 RepID=A0AA88VIK8_9ASTE|nr:hypothetical protein RJ639_015330 [Escallonia herrerae]